MSQPKLINWHLLDQTWKQQGAHMIEIYMATTKPGISQYHKVENIWDMVWVTRAELARMFDQKLITSAYKGRFVATY